MVTTMKKWLFSTKEEGKLRFNTRNIALIAIMTGLIMTLKFALGAFSGIEVVTLLVCTYALFTPLFMSMTTIVSFILLCAAIYGVGTWWVMYWIIFPTEALLTWGLKKFLRKNNFIFAIWVGFWGFSMIFWFAAHDVVLFDSSYAIAQMSSAVFTNTIEAIVNFVMGLLLFYPMQKLFLEKMDYQSRNYW